MSSTSFGASFLQGLENPAQLGQGLNQLGSLFRSTQGSTSPVPAIPMPQLSSTNRGAPIQASPTQIQGAVNTAGAQPMAVQGSPASTTTIPVPTANGVPVGSINGGDLNSVYGVDTGTALTNLYDSENQGSADSTAQAIINANAPNVAQGSANLNTQLAASGISPSSSVSAIENANYEGQVQQQDTSEIAQVSLEEQQQQQQLLESLLPGAQQHATDTSGWSIFGDVLSGIGDVIGL